MKGDHKDFVKFAFVAEDHEESELLVAAVVIQVYLAVTQVFGVFDELHGAQAYHFVHLLQRI